MTRSELQKILNAENGLFRKFISLDGSDINGYQDFINDVISGDFKQEDEYTNEIILFLKTYRIDLNEIKDD